MLALVLAGLAATQGSVAPPQIPAGEVVEKVQVLEDSTQSYAVYLPSSYARDRRWPILYLLDARGRALVPLERFREAAESLGFILASSHDSQSDRAYEPQIEVVRTLWRDTHRRFAIDDRRVYVAGFSGEARVACLMADAAPGSIAGVIACGGSFPYDRPPRKGLSFIFYGLAGTTDFNHDELVGLDGTLDALEIPHRIEIFDGGHAWPPAEYCAEALEWMELRAMVDGRRPRDDDFLDSLLAREIEKARTAEDEGRVHDAHRRYRAAARDFRDLRDVSGVEEKAAALGQSAELEKYLEARETRMRENAEYKKRAERIFAQMSPEGSRSLPRAISDLRVRSLKKQAESADDREERLSAQRKLESVFVQAAFYVPRTLFEREDYGRAIWSLSVAREIKPESPFVWYSLSRAYARAGRKKDALRSLKKAVELGVTDWQRIESDSDLETLKETEEFQHLLQELRNHQ
jgi:tetratricopeptide (TPR) repeat protein